MKRRAKKPGHVTKGSVLRDLNLPEEVVKRLEAKEQKGKRKRRVKTDDDEPEPNLNLLITEALIGKAVSYYLKGWRVGHLKSFGPKTATIIPIGALGSKTTLQNRVIPIQDVRPV